MRNEFKSEGGRRKIRLAILIFSCIVFLFAAGQLIRIAVGYHTSEKEYDEIRAAARETAASVSVSGTEEVVSSQSVPESLETIEATGSESDMEETVAATQPGIQTESDQLIGEAPKETAVQPLSEAQPQEPVHLQQTGSIAYDRIDYAAYEQPGQILISGSALDVLVEARYPMDFGYLLSINSEVVGWIRVEGTNIDYPMVQTTDNEKYLRLTISGEWNNAGSIFVDYRVAQPFVSENTIIHGHNQRNNMMFHALVNYADEAYFNQHQRIVIDTPDGACSTYQVFAFYQSPKKSVTYDCSYESAAEYQLYLDYIQEQNWYPNTVPVTTEDRIITLSTCSNEWDDTRYVIHAKKIS